MLKLVKMWSGGTFHVVLRTLKISLDRPQVEKMLRKATKVHVHVQCFSLSVFQA